MINNFVLHLGCCLLLYCFAGSCYFCYFFCDRINCLTFVYVNKLGVPWPSCPYTSPWTSAMWGNSNISEMGATIVACPCSMVPATLVAVGPC